MMSPENNTEHTASQPEQSVSPNDASAQSAPETGANGAADSQIAELEAQLKDKESKYVYLYADFENFKKRAIKERSDLIKFGWENVARDLLQVVDNLERALAHTAPGTDKNLITGLEMVLSQFRSTMQRQGVEPIASIGKTFDPNLHEAVGQEPSDQPSGTVIKEMSSGYTLHGRLLRPARVIISAS